MTIHESQGVEVSSGERFESLAVQVRSEPSNEALWDELEDWVNETNRPEEISSLYREVLAGSLEEDAAAALGLRAFNFHEEWFGEDAPQLIEVLERVRSLDASPTGWAFQRLTVLYTNSARWSELLELYDRAIDSPGADRRSLLREAAELAKDFAGQPDKAIEYFERLLPLLDDDEKVASSLERLLERQERFQDLVGFWERRLDRLEEEEARVTRIRAAQLWLDRLARPDEALLRAQTLLTDSGDSVETACALLEKIAGYGEANQKVRADALQLLRHHYDEQGDRVAIVPALEAASALSIGAERLSLHIEAGDRLESAGAYSRAMDHYSAVLELDPTVVKVREKLQRVAEQTGAHQRLLEILERAAAHAEVADVSIGLRIEAAHVRFKALEDTEGAIALYSGVLDESEVPKDVGLRVARRLAELYGSVGRSVDRLNMLERIAALEEDTPARRAVLSQAASLAEELGDLDRALRSWELCLNTDPGDAKAIAATVGLLERAGRYEDLAELLTHRADVAGLPRALRRSDKVRVAHIFADHLDRPDRSIEIWESICEEFGDENDAVEALNVLYERSGRSDDRIALLKRVSNRTRLRFAEIASRLGDALQEQPGKEQEASEIYVHALSLVPAHEGIRLGLRSLREVPEVRHIVVEALDRAYRTADEWEARLELLQDRLAVVEETTARAAILRDAAEIFEHRSGDPTQAFQAASNALALLPEDRSLEDEVARLAAHTGSVDEAAQAYERAALAVTSVSRRFELHQRAALSWESIERREPALQSWIAAIGCNATSRDAAESIVRLAGELGQLEQAESALAEALTHRPQDRTLLESLATVQRPAPSANLCDTLRTLSELRPTDLDLLREIAEIASDTLSDDSMYLSALRDLFKRAGVLLTAGKAACGTAQPIEVVPWSIDRLRAVYQDRQDWGAAASLLAEAARFPLETWQTTGYRRDAAYIRASKLGEPFRAISVYRELLDEAPEDLQTLASLAALYEAEGRTAELLALRQRELAVTKDASRRLELRLHIVQLMASLEVNAGPVAVLRANLEERPGHVDSLHALDGVLAGQSRYLELIDVLSDQAIRLEETASDRAAYLFGRVAELAEREIDDVDRAIAAHRRVAELAPTPQSIEALARIYESRMEHSMAARWLERRLEMDSGEAHAEFSLRLARAQLGAGRQESALAVLEAAWSKDPSATEVRELLSSQYEAQQAYAPLARLLAKASDHVRDQTELLAMIKRSAELFRELGEHQEAIAVLEKSLNLAPENRLLKSMLAHSLHADGRLQQSRDVLTELVESFGRRRGTERAAVHGQLARVMYEMDDVEGALQQLELATKMDMDNASTLRMLADVSREAGQFERAERTYRTLLLVARRSTGEEHTVGVAEVLFELHLLAMSRGDEEQAGELLESALEVTGQSDSEARMLAKALASRDKAELALRVLEQRIGVVEAPAARADLLTDIAAVLEGSMKQPQEALRRRLEALRLAPVDEELHRLVRKGAREVGSADAYVSVLTELIDNLRRSDDASTCADLILRLGRVAEEDLSDLDEALNHYRAAEATGTRRVDAWMALVRVARAKGDVAEQLRVLKHLVAEDALVADAKIEAFYRLAELLISAEDPQDSVSDEAQSLGLDYLERAYALDPRSAEAIGLLQRQLDKSSMHERALSLYETVTRESGDEMLILDFLERRVARTDATLSQVREAVGKALDLEVDHPGAKEKVEPLLHRAVALGETKEEGGVEARWALMALAERRSEVLDVRGAMRFLEQALAVTEEPEKQELSLRLARMALSDGGDAQKAIEILSPLHRTGAWNVDVWHPLLIAYRREGDESALLDTVAALLEGLLDVEERNLARMELAQYLMSLEERQFDAVEALKSILEEAPEHHEATRLLTSLYERAGYNEDLVELLQRQLDVARDNEDLTQIAEVALKLGTLLEKVRRDDAIDVYRQAREWVPNERRIILCLLELMGEDADVRERVEIREGLLASEPEESVAELMWELYAHWESLEDIEGMARVLSTGYQKVPHDQTIRTELESFFRAKELWEGLAMFLVAEATRDRMSAVPRLREAAALFREPLQRMNRAVEVLADLRSFAPEDMEVLSEFVQILRETGDDDRAIEEVSLTLERFAEPGVARLYLLRLRAQLRLDQERLEIALEDLEEAYAISAQDVYAEIRAALERIRTHAESASDGELARSSTYRLAEVLEAGGEIESMRDLLAQWSERHPEDSTVLLRLREIDIQQEHWLGVAELCRRLIQLQTGEEQLSSAIQLADACEAAGHAADALPGLEHVQRSQRGNQVLFERMRDLYESMGAYRELSGLLLSEAEGVEPMMRFELLRTAGQVFLERVGDAAAAIEPLEASRSIDSSDHIATLYLADAYTLAARFADSGQLLEQAISNHPKRRSPELSQLQHRMARLAHAAGDGELELQWLNAALDSDKNNGYVAAELARLAMGMGEHDVALNALRAVTLTKVPGPMSRATAYLLQARIAHARGEDRKAVLWARKARSEDPELQEAEAFLSEIDC